VKPTPESPRAGIFLLALVGLTTLVGAFLGWTLRPQQLPAERPGLATPAEANGSAQVPLATASEKTVETSTSADQDKVPARLKGQGE
jgi:hypothetical protein